MSVLHWTEVVSTSLTRGALQIDKHIDKQMADHMLSGIFKDVRNKKITFNNRT